MPYTSPTNESAEPGEIFEKARPLLTGLAYRILGSFAEAEDVVQDTFLRWMDADHGAIERPKSWLTTVCTRKSVDVLKSARQARTTYVGSWLPEPIETQVLDTPESEALLAESVTTAFLLVLERLAPKERAAFLLRDVFNLDYGDVATGLDINEASCRKLVSRARSKLQRANEQSAWSACSTSAVPRERQDELLTAFRGAIDSGSTDQLAQLLSADAVLSADGGGKASAIRQNLLGAQKILDFVRTVISPAWREGEILIREINSGMGLIARKEGRVYAAVSFAYDNDGNASGIFIMRNPDKLERLERSLQPLPSEQNMP